jgi:hypothetical protein
MTADRPIRGEVRLDGRHLTNQTAGLDIEFENGRSIVTVEQDDLYFLSQTPEPGQHILEVSFDEPGIGAFAFTFG